MLSDIISKYKGIVGAFILLPIICFIAYHVLKTSSRDKNSAKTDKVVMIAEHWATGKYDPDALKECSDIPTFSDFVKCHPEPLLCQLKKSGLKVVSHDLKRNGDLFLDLGDIKLLLKNKCHRVDLAEKIFSGGPRDFVNQIWDSYGQNISIDRFYVNTYQVARWKNPQIKLSYEESIKPATGLSIKERFDFCLDQGGHLLKSHVMDATSFYPQEGQVGLIKKSFYPWSKVSRLKKDCESFNYKGCPPISSMDRVGVSWNGVFHVLGSLPEVFQNPFLPKANLKVSHQELPAENPWHQLGLRATWEGRADFDFREKYLGKLDKTEEIKGVAFRCMYY